MNKIKKFKKSKKTNNKRNHKRRRMTRKLRGGIKELEGIFQEHDNETRPINERINQIVSTGELREQITALQRKIELLKSEDSEPFIPLAYVPGNSMLQGGVDKFIFFDKNITSLYPPSGNNSFDGTTYITIVNQLLKFKQLKKLFVDSLFLRGWIMINDDLNMEGEEITFISKSFIDGKDNRKTHCRRVINFFKKLNRELHREIKYMYSGKNSNRPATEYDLAGLEDILIQEGLLDRE